MNLEEQLKRDEHVVHHSYADSLGYLTIGVGFLIDERKGGYMPDAVIDFLLDLEIRERRDMLAELLPWFSTLDMVRQDCLVNMAFNLGINGLLSFKNTLHLIKEGDYAEAAKEMLNSHRAKREGNKSPFGIPKKRR